MQSWIATDAVPHHLNGYHITEIGFDGSGAAWLLDRWSNVEGVELKSSLPETLDMEAQARPGVRAEFRVNVEAVLSRIPCLGQPCLDPKRYVESIRGVIRSSHHRNEAQYLIFGTEGLLYISKKPETRNSPEIVKSWFLPLAVTKISRGIGGNALLLHVRQARTTIYLSDWDILAEQNEGLITADFLGRSCIKYGYQDQCLWQTSDGSDFVASSFWSDVRGPNIRLFLSSEDGLAQFHTARRALEPGEGKSFFGTHRTYQRATFPLPPGQGQKPAADKELIFSRHQLEHPGRIQVAISQGRDLWLVSDTYPNAGLRVFFMGLDRLSPLIHDPKKLGWNFYTADLPPDDGYIIELPSHGQDYLFCRIESMHPIESSGNNLFYVLGARKGSCNEGAEQLSVWIYQLEVRKMKHWSTNVKRWIWDDVPVAGSATMREEIPLSPDAKKTDHIRVVQQGPKGSPLLLIHVNDKQKARYVMSRAVQY
jgi:hypothetical protein